MLANLGNKQVDGVFLKRGLVKMTSSEYRGKSCATEINPHGNLNFTKSALRRNDAEALAWARVLSLPRIELYSLSWYHLVFQGPEVEKDELYQR
jgi:hypothetical protein